MNRTALKKQLEGFEGRKSHLYKDTAGKWTIGVGYCIETHGLPDDIIDELFDRRLTATLQGCVERVPGFRTLDEPRQHVLADMAYNLGVEGLLRFHQMFEAIERHDFAAAAAEMLDSKWAAQVGRRATQLAQTMRDGK